MPRPNESTASMRLRETMLGIPPTRLMRENEHLRTSLEELRMAHAKIRENQAKLEQENDRLRSPELHEARFLECDAGLAKVVFRGGNRLVNVAEDIDLNSLAPGQVVYLSREMNLIVAVSDTESTVIGEVAAVERPIADGRLIVTVRGEEFVVRTGRKLTEWMPKPGDEVVFDRDVQMALEPLPLGERGSWTLEEIPETPPERLGGYDAQRDSVLNRFTLAITQPELAKAYGISVNPTLMLEGPPGTGKTLMMRVMATVISRHTGKACRVASVQASELEDPFVGVTQQRVKKLFRELREAEGPRLLFIDEVEAIARRRGGVVGFHADRFLSTWLAEMQGLQGDSGVAMIATTNRRDLLDQAFAERFALVIRMERPRMRAAAEIFGIHFDESLPYQSNGTDRGATRQRMIDTGVAMLYAPNGDNKLAVLRFRDAKARTIFARELVSGRLIEQCCARARERAFLREADGGEPGLSVPDVERAVEEKIDQLASVLSVRNAHHYLTDLPTDVDVVSVEPMRRKGNSRRYLN